MIKLKTLPELLCHFVFKLVRFLDSRNRKLSSRIVAGTQADGFWRPWEEPGTEPRKDPIPWQVGIFSHKRNHIFCGGALLSNTHILTAAHCRELFDPEEDYIIRGTADRKERGNQYIHTIATRVEVHPLYTEFRNNEINFCLYDFMLLFLLKPLSLSDSSFARLPPPSFDEDFLNGKSLFMSGWGSTMQVTRTQVINFVKNGIPIPRKYPDRLQFVEIPYLPNRICQNRHHNFFIKYGEVKASPGSAFDIRVKDIDFDKEPGLSMFCTSMCTKEDLSTCPRVHAPKGNCIGDSGGKLIPPIKDIS